MKRDHALVPLSHDHHQALFVSHKLLRTSTRTAHEALADLRTYWHRHGSAHFRVEEEVLLPAYAGTPTPTTVFSPGVLCDHLAIRHRTQALERDAPLDIGALHELGGLISEHVRLEERELFPLIEAALTEAELAEVSTALEQTISTA